MRTDQHTANHGAPVRRDVFNSLLRICLLAGVFALGMWVGRQGPVLAPFTVRTEEQRTLPGSIAADLTPPAEAAVAPGPLLHALQSRIRVLRAENNCLTSTMNENRIHYQLLRNHGYDEHSPECLELVRRQNSLGHQLEELSVALSAWLAMESQLLESIRKHGPTREVPCTDRQLRQNIEQHLTRSGLNTTAPPPIPDELWVGGGDIRMGLPDNTRSTDRSADKTSPGHDHGCHSPML